MARPSDRPAPATPRSLSGLLPFLRPYRGRIALAILFLVLAAATTLAFPLALRGLIDGGALAPQADRGALRQAFGAVFGVAVAVLGWGVVAAVLVALLGSVVSFVLGSGAFISGGGLGGGGFGGTHGGGGWSGGGGGGGGGGFSGGGGGFGGGGASGGW